MEDTLKCPNCNESLKPNWKICPNCQQPVQATLPQKCPYCGEEQRDKEGKCIGCGKTIEEAETAIRAMTEKTASKDQSFIKIDKNQFYSKIKEQEFAEEQEKKVEQNKALQAQFRALVKSSREHIMNGDFNNALNEAKKALKINPSSALAAHPHSLIAEVYLKQNKLDEAITEVNEALKFNDKYWYALCVCAKIYYAGKNKKEMKNYIFQALYSVKEKELVLNSLSDIPNLEEIIADIENDEDEDEDYLDLETYKKIRKEWGG
jgi:tetratricopeptide (TPR) repeat protein